MKHTAKLAALALAAAVALGALSGCSGETAEAPAEEPVVVEPLADEKTDDQN